MSTAETKVVVSDVKPESEEKDTLDGENITAPVESDKTVANGTAVNGAKGDKKEENKPVQKPAVPPPAPEQPVPLAPAPAPDVQHYHGNMFDSGVCPVPGCGFVYAPASQHYHGNGQDAGTCPV